MNENFILAAQIALLILIVGIPVLIFPIYRKAHLPMRYLIVWIIPLAILVFTFYSYSIDEYPANENLLLFLLFGTYFSFLFTNLLHLIFSKWPTFNVGLQVDEVFE